MFSTQASDGRYVGPGGQDVVATDDGDRLLSHSWYGDITYRATNVQDLTWEDGRPVLAAAS